MGTKALTWPLLCLLRCFNEELKQSLMDGLKEKVELKIKPRLIAMEEA